MIKRVVSYVLIIAMISASIVSCNGREQTAAPQSTPANNGRDGGAQIADSPGELHNAIVERFFEKEWQGRPMTKDELISAVRRAGNEVLAERGIDAVSSIELAKGLGILGEAKRVGAFDVFSSEQQRVEPLIDYVAEQGIFSPQDVRAIESALGVVSGAGSDPRQSKSVFRQIRSLERDRNLGQAARVGLDVLAHSREFWTSRMSHMHATESFEGPVIIEPGDWPQNTFSYKALVTIAVDAIVMSLTAWAGAGASALLGALASIAFYTFSPEECQCPTGK